MATAQQHVASSTNHRFEIERTFRAPIEKVFAAWTSPQALMTWFAPTEPATDATVDLRIGGAWSITFPNPTGGVARVVGTYRKIVPPRRLVFTWRFESWRASHEDSIVTVELTPTANGTTLRLVHERLPDADAAARHEQGWSAGLAKFATYVDG